MKMVEASKIKAPPPRNVRYQKRGPGTLAPFNLHISLARPFLEFDSSTRFYSYCPRAEELVCMRRIIDRSEWVQ
jgi:hypothetical protein